jgi:hypothetical protein
MGLFYAALAAAFFNLSVALLIRPTARWLRKSEEAVLTWLFILGGVVSIGLVMHFIIESLSV